MKKMLIFVAALFLIGCGSGNRYQVNDDSDNEFLPSGDSIIQTFFYTDDHQNFYGKNLTFLIEENTVTIKSSSSSLVYNKVEQDQNPLTIYTTMDEWYSRLAIEKVEMEVISPDCIRLNNRYFYKLIPAKTTISENVHIVQKGQTLKVLSKLLGISKECISNQIGIPNVGDKIELDQCVPKEGGASNKK